MHRHSFLTGRRPRATSGISLIEVLVGLLLISFGLLGLISMLSRSIQFSVGAEDSQRAALLASEIATSILTSNTTNPGDITVDANTLSAWQDLVADPTGRGLPNGAGTVTLSGRTAQIVVQWRPPSAAAGTNNSYTTTLVLP